MSYSGPAKINLLPWREQLKEQKKREFLSILTGFVVLTALIAVFFHLYFANKISRQEGRNAYLEREIKTLDAKIAEIRTLKDQREELLARMRIIQQLQHARYALVYVFDELPRLIPDSIHLVRIEYKDNVLTIDGHADSNLGVSQLMRRIASSKLFYRPKLTEIKTTEKQGLEDSAFRVQVVQQMGKIKTNHLKKGTKK